MDSWKSILELHSRGRPVITATMFNRKTPAGYQHPEAQGYEVSRDGNEIRVRLATFGIRKFSLIDGYEIGSLGRGNGWYLNLEDVNAAS